MVGYQICIIGYLDFEAALLFFFLCADPAVGGNPKLSFFFFVGRLVCGLPVFL
jgi:hypothetical protein